MIKTYKDNQIIYENWMQTLTRRAEEGLRTLTIRKPVVKHIPVWVEFEKGDMYSVDGEGRFVAQDNIRWIDNIPYKTYKQGDK